MATIANTMISVTNIDTRLLLIFFSSWYVIARSVSPRHLRPGQVCDEAISILLETASQLALAATLLNMRQCFCAHEPSGFAEPLEIESQQGGRYEAIGFESVEVAEHILRFSISNQPPVVDHQHTIGVNDCQVNIVCD